jgi:hypothetical protein
VKAIPVGGAALGHAVRRTVFVASLLAVVVGAAALAFNVAARRGESERPTLLAAGDSVVVVLDLSISIPEAAYTRMRNAMNVLAASDARVGLVIFSDLAYEVLPAGSPPAELKPVIRYLTPITGEVDESTGRPVYPVDPWSNGFRGGTRISGGIDLAREMILSEGDAGSVLLLSDLDTAGEDTRHLTDALRRLRQADIPMRIVPIYPLAENRAYFAQHAGEDAFSDWNRFLDAGGVTARFRPPETGPSLVLLLTGAALLLVLGVNELLCRRLDLPAARELA